MSTKNTQQKRWKYFDLSLVNLGKIDAGSNKILDHSIIGIDYNNQRQYIHLTNRPNLSPS